MTFNELLTRIRSFPNCRIEFEDMIYFNTHAICDKFEKYITESKNDPKTDKTAIKYKRILTQINGQLK